MAISTLIFLGGCGRRAAAHRPGAAPQWPAGAVPSGPPPPAELQPPIPGQYTEEGIASWYGGEFNGRHTSNGEKYDMYQLTAAHRTLPFGARVRVTNKNNGKQTEVRINDRGPFVANRVIDLSYGAARALDMIGTGTAPVRLEMIEGTNPYTGSFAVQVGAFLLQENADRLRASFGDRYGPVEVVAFDSPNGRFYRVRVGRLPTENGALQLQDQLRAEGQTATFVVRLDD